jgi:hypothetical protein
MALNISIVTRIDRETVDAFLAASPPKISQPISGNRVEHWRKWDCSNMEVSHRKGDESTDRGGRKGANDDIPIGDMKVEVHRDKIYTTGFKTTW